MSLIRLSLNCCCFTTWFILLSVTKKSLPLTGQPFYANGPSDRKEIKSNQITSLICMIGQHQMQMEEGWKTFKKNFQFNVKYRR